MLNDGKGHFTHVKDALPKEAACNQAVRAADFDLDGDCFEADGKLVEKIVEAIGTENCIKINNFLFIHN